MTGNTDRHQDNWGLILKDAKIKGAQKDLIFFSPAFDNGTALAFEIDEKYIDEDRLDKYLTNPRHARHHMKWSLDDHDDMNFYEFMKKFVVEFDESKDIISNHLRFNQQQVEDVMNPLVNAVTDDTFCLSRKRLQFIIKLIIKRKKLKEKSIGI